MLNSVNIYGRLVKDPELKSTSAGKAVCTFYIANERGSGDKKRSCFFTVNAWEGTAELVAKYFKKGYPINISGNLDQRTWTDQSGNKRDSVEIVAKEIQFVWTAEQARAFDAKQAQGQEAASPPPAPAPAVPAQPAQQTTMTPQRPYGAAEGEELPF